MIDESNTPGGSGGGGGDDDLTPPGGIRILPPVNYTLADLAMQSQHHAEAVREAIRQLGEADAEHRQVILIETRDALDEHIDVLAATRNEVDRLRHAEAERRGR